MLLRYLRFVVGMATFLVASIVQAFVDTPTLTPAAPMAGQTVSVSILAGYCDAFIARPGNPQITQVGNAIRVLLDSVHVDDFDFCIYDQATAVFPIGAYAQGTYTVQVDRYYLSGPFGPTIVTETLGILPLIVTGSPVVELPSLGNYGVLLLVLALVVVAHKMRKRSIPLVLLALMQIPITARAQDADGNQFIEVMLSAAPGAPTPEQVVGFYEFSPPPQGDPPLQGLMVENPQAVSHLLPIRETGDLLSYFQSNPGSAGGMGTLYFCSISINSI